MLTIRTDVTKTAEVVAAAQKVKEVYGRLDILINNAGYLEDLTLLGDSDPVDWWTSFEVNVKGTYEPIRALLPLLIESNGDKTIVNISTIAAHFPEPKSAAYKVRIFLPLEVTTGPTHCMISPRSSLSCDSPNSSISSTATRVLSHTLCTPA